MTVDGACYGNSDCPGADGFCDDDTAVVVAGGPFTVWLIAGEVEPEKVLSPL